MGPPVGNCIATRRVLICRTGRRRPVAVVPRIKPRPDRLATLSEAQLLPVAGKSRAAAFLFLATGCRSPWSPPRARRSGAVAAGVSSPGRRQPSRAPASLSEKPRSRRALSLADAHQTSSHAVSSFPAGPAAPPVTIGENAPPSPPFGPSQALASPSTRP
jgi:hypothetical protein